MRRLSLTLITFAATLAGQSFEVATVKPSPDTGGDRINIDLGSVRNGKLTFTNASLSDCLRFAYDLVSDEQLAGPDWIKSKAVRFDIVAEAPAGTAREQYPAMLRKLLGERLNLEIHHESKTVAHMALTVGKQGPRMKPVEFDTSGPGNPSGLGKITGNYMPMQRLAMLLSRFERQTVLDETGLKGSYQFTLEWTPDDPRAPDAGASGPSIFTAVQEQLGLRLEKRKGPIDVLVVDRADRVPAAN